MTICKASQTLNELAARGIIRPVTFTMFDGVRRTANSVWAATEFLKEAGAYKQKIATVWEM